MYITNADIQNRLGDARYVQLTDDLGTGTADDTKVDEARLGAEGEVNSYLAARYAVPVDTGASPELQALLSSVTLDLAEYRLHARRSPVPPDLVRRRAEAVQWLARVAAAEVVLPSVTALAANPALGLSGKGASQTPTFTRQAMADL